MFVPGLRLRVESSALPGSAALFVCWCACSASGIMRVYPALTQHQGEGAVLQMGGSEIRWGSTHSAVWTEHFGDTTRSE